MDDAILYLRVNFLGMLTKMNEVTRKFVTKRSAGFPLPERINPLKDPCSKTARCGPSLDLKEFCWLQ